MISKDPKDYEDDRILALIEDIEAIGIEESLMTLELAPGQKVKISGVGNMFEATGPLVLFIGVLPMEAFDKEG